MDYAVEIYKLSTKFYIDYPETQYPELMKKDNRPYTCLLIETKDEYFICVPFRSNITHVGYSLCTYNASLHNVVYGIIHRPNMVKICLNFVPLAELFFRYSNNVDKQKFSKN